MDNTIDSLIVHLQNTAHSSTMTSDTQVTHMSWAGADHYLLSGSGHDRKAASWECS